jgi:RNA polymerase sigma factor (sigma-70 family)
MSASSDPVQALVDHLFRQEAGRMVAILTRLFGIHNLGMVEDIIQDTLHQALKDWSIGSIPDNPSGWLMVVAKRKAINAVRRERLHRSFARDMDAMLKSEWTAGFALDQVFLEDEIKDSQLRMIFTCCHPSLPMEGQLALTLKTLCGFTIPEIAAALLTTESNINKRLYRAKEKIRNEEIPFTVPAGHHLLSRLDAVLLVIYLLFNEGYNSSGDNPVIRQDLCLEAMRLAMLLTEKPVTNSYPPVYAMLALLCLHSARLDARLDTNNSLIVLEEQDRARWNRALIDQGLQFLWQATAGDLVTAYHLEAAIAAEHCLAPDFASTNWERIHNYYVALEKLKPSSVIRLNLAIVTGKKDGPRAALRLLHELEQHRALDNYYLLPASLGEFYQELGQLEEARSCFRRAQELTRSAGIREVLERKISQL